MTEQVANDWITDPPKRKSFWAATHDLDLTEAEAREALGLGPDESGEYASTKTYPGTFDDALAAIAEFAEKKASDESAEAVRASGEPPCVLFSQALTKTGWECNFTVRGATLGDALHEFARITRKFRQSGAVPLYNQRFTTARPAGGTARRRDVPTPEIPQGEAQPRMPDGPPRPLQGQRAPQQQKPTPSPPPSQDTPQGAWEGYESVKTGRIGQVEVNPSGQIKIYADGAQYPVKDSRGPEIVADKFDEDCWQQGFTPAQLAEPGWYHPEGLFMTYGKNVQSGYWDILWVHTS